MTQIKFSQTVSFTGRNGCFKSIGLDLFQAKQILSLAPITTKNEIGNCSIEIPISDIPALIEELQKLVKP